MMPLTDRDFAKIRGNVMREIARRQRRNTWVLAASVAFAVIAMVFVLVPRPMPKSENHAAEVGGATQKPTARPSVAPPTSAATVVATQTLPKKHHRKRHHPIAIASAELHQPMTIELQTANPDVRIIWIAK
jgi:hypothetical protein